MKIIKYLLGVVLVFSIGDSLLATTLNEKQGKKIYHFACQNCHSPKLTNGVNPAPAAFDKVAWKQRIMLAKRAMAENPDKYKSIYDYFLYQVKLGKGLMHHGGLCFETEATNKDCSDDALISAIKYMLTEPSATDKGSKLIKTHPSIQKRISD